MSLPCWSNCEYKIQRWSGEMLMPLVTICDVDPIFRTSRVSNFRSWNDNGVAFAPHKVDPGLYDGEIS